MYKLILFTLLSAFFIMLHGMQVDQHLSMQSLFQAKYALNRSTHAAAQQLDMEKLSIGIASIDRDAAQWTAQTYLQRNLNLDASNMPLPHTFLQSKVDILVFEVINENQQFPYKYMNSDYDYHVELEKPGVIMIIRVVYPRTYNILGPITWEIKGAAETVGINY
jgi:hypothetical protein